MLLQGLSSWPGQSVKSGFDLNEEFTLLNIVWIKHKKSQTVHRGNRTAGNTSSWSAVTISQWAYWTLLSHSISWSNVVSQHIKKILWLYAQTGVTKIYSSLDDFGKTTAHVRKTAWTIWAGPAAVMICSSGVASGRTV